jgi:hypothetical protein
MHLHSTVDSSSFDGLRRGIMRNMQSVVSVPSSYVGQISHHYVVGKFLYDNYVQALRNIAALSEYLTHSMKVLSIPSDHTFVSWHQAERDYLLSLKHEPEVDILHIEYLETLIKLRAAK